MVDFKHIKTECGNGVTREELLINGSLLIQTYTENRNITEFYKGADYPFIDEYFINMTMLKIDKGDFILKSKTIGKNSTIITGRVTRGIS